MSALGVSVMASIGEALATIVPVPFVVADDVSWRVVAANDHAEVLYGGSLVGVALESLFTLDGERAVERAVWLAQTSDEPVDLYFERIDGTSAEVRARAHRLDLSGCTACLIVLEDVSRVRLLARTLANSGRERRTLLDALGLGVVEVDTSGRILDHNHFLPIELLFPSGLIGRNFFIDVAAGPGARQVFQQYQSWMGSIIDAPFRESFEFELGRHLVEAEMIAGGFTTCDAIIRLSDATLRRKAEAELRRQAAQAEEVARRSRLVQQTASLLHQSFDLETVLETAVAETGRLLGASCCQIAFVDPMGDVTIAHEHVRASQEFSKGLAATFDLLPATSEALRSLQPVVIEQSSAMLTSSDSGPLGRSGAASAIVAPIAVRREPRGVLAVLQSDRARSWTEGDVELAVSIASQVGLSIGHWEIHENARRQVEHESTVARLAVAVHSAASRDEALSRVAELLMTATESDEVSVLCRGPEPDRYQSWCWKLTGEGAIVSADPALSGLDARARLALDGEPTDADSSFSMSFFSARQGVDGVLAVHLRTARVDSDTRALLDAVAVHVGLAIGALSVLGAVSEAKRVWEGAFDSLPDGVVVVDASSSVIRSNRAFAAMVRSKPSAMVGQPLTSLVAEETGTAIVEALSRVDSGRRPVQIEVEDAALGRWLALSVSRLETASNPSFILSIRDVTNERTIAENLAQSSKMASIGQLATGVAHEINTPLATIAGSAQSLDRQLSSLEELRNSDRWPSIRERIDAIVEQSFRCKRITRDLLDFAAPTRPRIQECDIASIASGAIAVVARERNTERVRLRESGTAMPLYTDPDLVSQILINLIANGLDAIESRPRGRLSIEIRHLARGARVIVKDTGPGISAVDLERIFDPFFTTKQPGRGTGLGLSISRSLVSRLGGRLDAVSTLGKGATFTLVLPRSRVSEEAT
jgi:PAS domain S-box-containing protein